MVNELNDITGTADVQEVSEVSSPLLEQAADPTIVREKIGDEYVNQGKEPNVKLSSQGQALNAGPVIIGRTKVVLPDEATQRAGFYSEYAGDLVAQYRQYKFVEKLGTKNVQ